MSTAEISERRNDSTWTGFFTNTQWVFYAIIIVTGLLLRWLLLDMRPYHHDESLHGMYGRYFYDFPESNYYRYDPMLHGPMLYNCMRFIYATFGDSLWAARTPVCIMGSLFLFAPFVFRRYLAPISTLLLTAFIAFSPTLIYWSRFLREDYWVVSGMLMCLYGLLAAPPRMKAFWMFMGLSIQWCTKENIFVTLAVVVGYLVFELAFRYIMDGNGTTSSEPTERKPLLVRIKDYVLEHPWGTAWGLIAAILVYCWFYSAGFRFAQGIKDGLGYKGFEYWLEHHGKERIEGPFNFHVYVLGWYELPFMVAFLTHLGIFYRQARSEIRFLGAFALALFVISAAISWNWNLKEVSPWSFFKLKDLFDMAGLFVLLFHAPIVTVHHLLRREYGLAACGYFFTATFFVYSYLGEKVPWLSIYPLIFGLPYLTLFFQDYFCRNPIDYRNFPVRRFALYVGIVTMLFGFWFVAEEWLLGWIRQTLPLQNPSTASWSQFGSASWQVLTTAFQANSLLIAAGALLVLLAVLDTIDTYLGTMHLGWTVIIVTVLFSIRAAIQTNYLYAGKETEYISQVHTTYEAAAVAKKIINEVLTEENMYKPKVFVTGEGTWPLTWYFRHLRDEYKFVASAAEKSNFTYLFQDWKENAEPGFYPDGYYVRRLNLRGWWVPDFKQMTLKKFLRVSVNHYPWSSSGFTYITILEAKDTDRFKPTRAAN